jgi:hypothetical protein
MTDTARTVAQIKALFADNTTGEISPQDMRDFVESIMRPVQGGGFDRDIGLASIFSIDPSMTPVANATYTPYKVYTPADPQQTHVYDELGIRQTAAPYVSTYDGLTHAAGSWWSLPYGTWLMKMHVRWSTSSSAGTRQLTVGPIDNRGDTDDVDHLFWAPGYQDHVGLGGLEVATGTIINGVGNPPGLQAIASVCRVRQSVAPAAFGASLYQDSGAPLALSSGHVVVMRIG